MCYEGDQEGDEMAFLWLLEWVPSLGVRDDVGSHMSAKSSCGGCTK